MPLTNGQSRQRGIRILLPHDKHLQEKAIKNPDNKHNNISTEINILIEADYKKAHAPKAKSKK